MTDTLCTCGQALGSHHNPVCHLLGTVCMTNIEIRSVVYRDVSSIADDELLKRAVKSARAKDRKPQPRWVGVMRVFQLGSGYGRQLCIRFGLDADELVKP